MSNDAKDTSKDQSDDGLDAFSDRDLRMLVRTWRAAATDIAAQRDKAQTEIERLRAALVKADAVAKLARSFAGDVGLHYEHSLWDALEDFDKVRPAPETSTEPPLGERLRHVALELSIIAGLGDREAPEMNPSGLAAMAARIMQLGDYITMRESRSPVEPPAAETEGEPQIPDPCEECGKPVYGYVPHMCCDGRECACQGRPIEPCWCDECWAKWRRPMSP